MNLFFNLIKVTKFFVVCMVTLGIMTDVVKAASSQWQGLGGAKVRLVALLDPKTNLVSGVIEVKLEPGWSTYWRNPGSAGIPPRFDFSQSQNFDILNVKFPVPQLLETYGTQYAGYKKQVNFPFNGNVKSLANGDIKLDLQIGICSEICVPAKAILSLPIASLLQSDPVALKAVTFANLSVPRPATKDVVMDVKKTEKPALLITVKHKAQFGVPNLFVDGIGGWYLKPAKLVQQKADHAIFELDLSQVSDHLDLTKQTLKFTLVTGSSGVVFEH